MITVEHIQPDDEATFRALGDLLLPMAGEIAVVPVDVIATTREVYAAINEGNAFAAKNDDGAILGVLILVRTPYWYAPDHYFLTDRIFYVSGEWRQFALVGVKLMRAAKEMAEPRGEAIFLHIQNRHRRAPDHPATHYSHVAGYTPFGHVTAIRPDAGDAATLSTEAGTA